MFASGLARSPTSSRRSAIDFAGTIPNNYRLVREAIDRGVPLDEVKPGNNITAQLKKLMLPQSAPRRPQPRRRQSVWPSKLELVAAGRKALADEHGRSLHRAGAASPGAGAGRSTRRRACAGADVLDERPTPREPHRTKPPAEPANPLLTDKLLDAKVRLHRRLIEEINLSALEKLPEDEMRAHIQQLVTQYIVVERLALNTQELNEFVSEILDEMTGLGPLEPLLKDPTINDILINGHECDLVERHGVLEPIAVPLQGRGASAAHHQQDRLGGRPPRR